MMHDFVKTNTEVRTLNLFRDYTTADSIRTFLDDASIIYDATAGFSPSVVGFALKLVRSGYLRTAVAQWRF